MAVKELGHLVLYVHDLERSAAFTATCSAGTRSSAPVATPTRPPRSRSPSSAAVTPTTSCCSSRSVRTPPVRSTGRHAGLYHFV